MSTVPFWLILNRPTRTVARPTRTVVSVVSCVKDKSVSYGSHGQLRHVSRTSASVTDSCVNYITCQGQERQLRTAALRVYGHLRSQKPRTSVKVMSHSVYI